MTGGEGIQGPPSGGSCHPPGERYAGLNCGGNREKERGMDWGHTLKIEPRGIANGRDGDESRDTEEKQGRFLDF